MKNYNITSQERTELIIKKNKNLLVKTTIFPNYTFNGFNDWKKYIRNELDKYMGWPRYTMWKQ